MIQNFSTFKKQVNALNDIIKTNAQLQKIYTTSFYLCLAVRAPGKTHYLLLGRGKGQEGIWFKDENVQPFLRKKDQFLEYLRKHMMGVRLIGADIPFNDRLWILRYQKWGVENQLIIFYQGRSFLFIHCYMGEDKKYHVLSNDINNNVRDELYSNEEIQEIWKDKLKNFEEQKIKVGSVDELIQEEKIRAESSSKSKSQKFLKRKEDKIQKDLNKVKKWQELQDRINMYYQTPFPLGNNALGLNIKFRPDMSEGQKLNKLYEKVKKFKKAEGILTDRLAETQKKIMKSEQSINTLKVIQIFHNETKKAPEVKKNEFDSIEMEHFKMGWGISASGNDQLRKLWAHKEDIWFHINNAKSAHIILKGLNISELNEIHFKLVAQKMMELAKTPYSEMDLVYTQVKNLKGVKGIAGSVTLKKQKYYKIIL